MSLLDTFENKYIIKGILKAESSFHIGTGSSTDTTPTAVDCPVIRDENGNPFIPGSSLKGVLRTFVESLINSGVFEDLRACNIVSSPCIGDKEYKELKGKLKDEKQLAEKTYELECDVCKLFGGKHFAAKLHILDAKLKEGTKAYTQVRDGIAIDRDTLTAAKGMKYDFECVDAGTQFDFEMSVDNLDEKHEKLLKVLLTYLKSGEMKVGGKTSAGLGTVKLYDEKVYRISKDDMESVRKYFISGLNDELLYDMEADV